MGLPERPQPGAPWPNGEHGEVVGPEPTYARCFTPDVAGAIAGRSSKWARGLAARGKVTGYRESGGHKRVFLDAASFETFGSREGWWPPPLPPAELDWQALAAQQEKDLEGLRRRLLELQEEHATTKAHVEALRAELDDTLSMVSRLAEMARRR